MSTSPRAKIAECFAEFLREEACEQRPYDFADAVLAALDLDARDARVRAEALREHAARMREKAVNLPEHTGASWPWTGYLVAAKHAEYAADEIALASPSSSPVDAPSRPTGTPGPTVVASSVPTDTGTCRNCGGPVRYNLAVGWCAHIEARDFVACCDPWPARPGPDPSPECSTSHPAVHADCDGCTCTCHTDGES